VTLDPSRVAAQIVSGIGFIGGGVIFVRRDVVSGLTTAAAVWTTSAVGMAAGAGLPLLAGLVTALHFVAVLAFPPLVVHLGGTRLGPSRISVTYDDGRGVLRTCLAECTARGFAVRHLDSGPRDEDGSGLVSVALELTGRSSIADMAAALSEIDGVRTVSTAGTTD